MVVVPVIGTGGFEPPAFGSQRTKQGATPNVRNRQTARLRHSDTTEATAGDTGRQRILTKNPTSPDSPKKEPLLGCEGRLLWEGKPECFR